MKFLSESLPELNYRISLDYGEVSFAKTTDSTTLDIFSTTVNVCAKINNLAAPNTVVVGGDMYQMAKNLSGYTFQSIKKSISVSDRPYPVYIVSEAKTIREYLVSRKRLPIPVTPSAADMNAIGEVKTA
jgi:class 3 adenylate cyclase